MRNRLVQTRRCLKAAVRPAKAARADGPKAHVVSKEAKKLSADEASKNALMLRFSNENSYLNWARNGVMSSGVGVAMYAQEHHRGAQLSGAGLLLLGFGYIGVGSFKYMFYILRFRQVMGTSWPSVVASCSHAAVALGIWLTATASFLESIPLEMDVLLLEEPFIQFLPSRIAQGLIQTYNLQQDEPDPRQA
ncbi:hypothetical protein H310_05997 [Aphanomyces invadans]|uniref:DUF202 domain-containing protein n=1 Tax=Aphanomyces invadans TaxID=157072 RepID=A0A024UA71_9STRA|nr:hypothetical protein H310_05997 [Aphanomyces invadans]ETW02498.1 hypothetical protein H310_05997 [Aphanomyces invadans]|eukprot:XP_008869103.1 hypothetical protein H310_05997 [Aphanomyces invadans]